MLRDDLADDLQADELAPGFIRPAWNDYCFANIPDTVLSLLNGEANRPLPTEVFEDVPINIDHVVVAFVDGLGWKHFRRSQSEHPFLELLADHAVVTPLTSIYPSETAAAVSTVHTGKQPVEHGVLGWNAYIEELGGYIQTLPFADRDRTPLSEVHDDPDPAQMLDTPTVYERLEGDSVLVQPDGIGESAYASQANRGAECVDYNNVAQAAYRIRETLEAANMPTYCYCYLPNVDAFSHKKGVAHPETDAQLGAICHALQREVIEKLNGAVAERTLLLVTADHGEVDSTPETTVDLGTLELNPHLSRTPDGEPIPALGGPRNLQFYARDGHRDALRTELERGLAPLDPLTLTRETITEEELFGDRELSERFLQRCPDLLAVPAEGMAWYDGGHLSNVSGHGGLHSTEMLVPFAAARIDTLQSHSN
jgi:hypothetical protein